MKDDFERFSYYNLLQVIHTFFFLAISSSIHRYFNNTFREFKAMKKVISTGTFNVDFIINSLNLGLFSFFKLFFILSDLILTYPLLGRLAFVLGYRNQWQILGRKVPSFGWATFG